MRGPSLVDSKPFWARFAEALGRQTEHNEKARHKVVEQCFFTYLAVFLLRDVSVQFLWSPVSWDLGRAVELLEGSEVFSLLYFFTLSLSVDLTRSFALPLPGPPLPIFASLSFLNMFFLIFV